MSEDTTAASAESRNALVRRDNTPVSLMPHDVEGVYKVAQRLANSGMVPSAMRGNTDAVFAAILLSHELGVSPMQGISNIAVVNGRASIWGELATAIVRNSGLCEYLAPPKFTGTGASLKCTVVGKRRGEKDEVSFDYSMEDAKIAGHLNKDTYLKNPKDMIMWKALHRLYKFLWADVLKGLSFRELAPLEVMDVESERVVLEAAPEPTPEKAPEPKPQLSNEELLAKAEKARAKLRAKEEAEKPVASQPEAPKAPPVEPKEAPEAEVEAVEPAKTQGAELPTGEKRHIGTVIKCPYKPNADKSGYDYFVDLQTGDGDLRFKCTVKAQAEELTKFKGKTMMVIANAKNEVVRYGTSV